MIPRPPRRFLEITPIQITDLTPAHIGRLDKKAATTFYNLVAEEAGVPVRKGFRSLEDAQAKLAEAIDIIRARRLAAKKAAIGTRTYFEHNKVRDAEIGRKWREKNYRPKPVTVGGVIQSMIFDGKTNAEIWEVVQKQFNLDNSKVMYPAWNRSRMKRRGLI